MKKFFGVLALVIGSFQSAQAAMVGITQLNVSYVHINAFFLVPISGGGVTLDLTTPGVNLIGGYIPEITATPIGPAGTQVLYTAAANQNPLGTGMPPIGSITGGLAPSGFLDTDTNTITVDMSSLFANHGSDDQNIGGIATGFFNPNSGGFLMSLTSVLSQGPAAGEAITVTFAGQLSTTAVPVPGAILLMGSGLIGLVGIARRKRVM